jgi:hypothetical protein
LLSARPPTLVAGVETVDEHVAVRTEGEKAPGILDLQSAGTGQTGRHPSDDEGSATGAAECGAWLQAVNTVASVMATAIWFAGVFDAAMLLSGPPLGRVDRTTARMGDIGGAPVS